MRRISDSSANAMIIALLVVVITGGLAAAVFTQGSFTEERSAKSRAERAAVRNTQASLDLAIAKVLRVGSAAADETSCSQLDEPANTNCATVPAPETNVNGVDASDGTWHFTVRGSGATRVITAYGSYGGKVKTRRLTFAVVPRVFRYALFADNLHNPGNGSGAAGAAVDIGDYTRVLAPPAYPSALKARGGDIGANASFAMSANARVNVRAADATLYDRYFMPAGSSGNATASPGYYNGDPWGVLTLASGTPQPDAQAPSGSAVTSFPAGAIANLDGSVRRLATTTALPRYGSLLAGWRAAAAANAAPNPNQGQTGSLYTGAQFAAALAAGSQVFNGLVFVDCRNGYQNLALAAAASVQIINGGLVLHGCDLTVPGTASLQVTHNMTSAASPTHQLPGVMALRSGASGGSLTFGSGGAASASVDGVTFADADITVTASSANASGNFLSNGAVIAGGRFITRSTGGLTTGPVVILRWNPLAQRMAFDTANAGQMGTYSIRTDDRPPPNAPTIAIATKPANPSPSSSTPAADVSSFSWTVTGDLDLVQCQIDGGAWTPCSGSKSYTGLAYGQSHTFSVQACNVTSCATDSWTWYIKNPTPVIVLDAGPKPPASTNLKAAGPFTWTTQWPVTTLDCKLDAAAYAPCASGGAGTSFTGLSYAAHTFTVRACNADGCATDAYTWTVVMPAAPTVTITPGSKPANPSAYTADSANFAWTNTSYAETTQCKIDAGAYGSCTSPQGYSGLSHNASHTFTVRVCNDAGCATDAWTWFINPDPPTVTLGAKPANPSVYTTTSSAVTWTTTGFIASTDCRLDGGAWGSCSSGWTPTWTICSFPDHTLDVRVTNATSSATASWTWHANCGPVSVSTFTPPGDYAFSSGTYSYTVPNLYNCTVDIPWIGAGQACASLTSMTMASKPFDNSTVTFHFCNRDNTSCTNQSDNWDREGTEFTNNNLDDGTFWAGWNGCSGAPWGTVLRAELYGLQWIGSSIWLQSNTNVESGAGCAGSNATMHRGDDIRYAQRTDNFGAVRLGWTHSHYFWWDGSAWQFSGMDAPAGAPQQPIDGTWRWHRLRGEMMAAGTTVYFRIWAWNAGAFNCGGTGRCGAEFDGVHGVFSRQAPADRSTTMNAGVNGYTNF